LRPAQPPRIATWIFEHITPGSSNEALAGDLLEEFRRGRSTGWYWRQVLAAIAIACFRETLNRRAMLLFAALWSMLAPAWLLFIFRMEIQSNIVGPIWRMDWPWSTLCIFCLLVAENLIFVWTGILVYAIPHMAMSRTFSARQLRRGFLLSLPVFVAVSAAMLALAMLLPSAFHAMNPRTLTPLGQITDLGMWAVAARIPFLLALICALWGVASRSKNGRKKIVV